MTPFIRIMYIIGQWLPTAGPCEYLATIYTYFSPLDGFVDTGAVFGLNFHSNSKVIGQIPVFKIHLVDYY